MKQNGAKIIINNKSRLHVHTPKLKIRIIKFRILKNIQEIDMIKIKTNFILSSFLSSIRFLLHMLLK